jgi:beta-galactosidase/beta-glucuronidase
LVWGEAANAYQYSPEYATRFAKEWQEAIFRDYNHPSIIAWVPLNESWGVPRIREHAMEQQHALAMYHLTKSLDSTRLVISNDGWEHMKSDLCTLHDYEADRDVLTERYATTEHAIHAIRTHQRQTFVGGFVYEDQPIIVSEFGGIAYRKSEWEGWGYSGADNDDDFLQKLKATVEPLLNSSVVDGFCYTQLTDVEQEINGLLTYDRKPKLPVELIRSVIGGKRCIVPCV